MLYNLQLIEPENVEPWIQRVDYKATLGCLMLRRVGAPKPLCFSRVNCAVFQIHRGSERGGPHRYLVHSD